jgi:hypothetical protein
LLYYAKLIPIELDDAARIDGASVIQLYLRIGQFLYRSLASPSLPRSQNNLSSATCELTGNLEANAAISTSHNNDGCAYHVVFSKLIG